MNLNSGQRTRKCRYNQIVRHIAVSLAFFALVGCNRSIESEEAVRQGVIDYLSNRSNLNVKQMNINVNSVVFRGNEADAVVAFAPKGGGSGQGMEMRYTLQRQGNRWVVKGRSDVGKNPHGAGAGPGGGMQGGAMPGGMANPHGGGMGQGAAGQMPPGHPAIDSKK